MKSPQCLAILFVLLFTLTDNPAGTNLKFPDEIPAHVSWGGATVSVIVAYYQSQPD